MIVARSFARAEYRDLPELCQRVRIEGIDRVVLRDDENHVMRASRYRQVGNIKWLRIHLAVHGKESKFAEIRGVHIAQRQEGFI